MYKRQAIGCGFTATESGGWFKNHYKSVGELKGINMRIYGLGAKVMQKIGVKTQVVSFKEIKNAFKKGKIDAAEFGYPAIDYLIGMHNLAKYNYYPGWQQQFAVVDFIVQKALDYNLGARGLRSLCEGILNHSMFELPGSDVSELKVTKSYAEDQLKTVELTILKAVS